MKTLLPWIAAAAGVVAATYVLMNLPEPQRATGLDGVEDAARKTSAWGSKQRLGGMGGNLVGKLKEGFGRATGSSRLTEEGADDQAVGSLKDAAGEVAQAAGQTLHDLNV